MNKTYDKGNLFKNYLEPKGIIYIKDQKGYLIISFIGPFFSLFVSLLNLFFILLFKPSNAPQPPPHVQPLQTGFELALPFVIIIVFSIFALVKFMFLVKWRKQVHSYEKSLQDHNNDEQQEKSTTSLTAIFYNIVENMERIRWLFLLLNILFLLNLHWYVSFFVRQLQLFEPEHPLFPPPNLLLEILNISSIFVLFLYILYEWFHFLKWNKKLSKLQTLEHDIFKELNLEEKNFLDY